MHPAIIIGTVRSLIVDVAMGQIPRSTERISSSYIDLQQSQHNLLVLSPNLNASFHTDTECFLNKEYH